MAGEIIRLVGDDGLVLVGDLQAELVGDNVETLDELAGGAAASGVGAGFYQITALAAIPVFTWTARVGDFFYNDGTMILKVGDKVRALPDPDVIAATVKGWSIDIQKTEYDSSAFEDDQQIVRYGKRNTVAGSLTAVEDLSRPFFVKKLMDRLKVSAAGAYTMERLADTAFYVVLFKQAQWIPGETVVALCGKVMLGSGGAGAQAGSSQEFTANFKPTTGGRIMQVEIDVPLA